MAIFSIVLSGVPAGSSDEESSTLRGRLEGEAPNWQLYWADRQGSDVVYYVEPVPRLADHDPGGRDDFLRLILILWEDAARYWESLPPSGDIGTCTVALVWTVEAMSSGGEATEIMLFEAMIGAAQVDVMEALSVGDYRDMGDNRFSRWLLDEFPSFECSQSLAGKDQVLGKRSARSYVEYVQNAVKDSVADGHMQEASGVIRPPDSLDLRLDCCW